MKTTKLSSRRGMKNAALIALQGKKMPEKSGPGIIFQGQKKYEEAEEEE